MENTKSLGKKTLVSWTMCSAQQEFFSASGQLDFIGKWKAKPFHANHRNSSMLTSRHQDGFPLSDSDGW